MDEKFGPNLIKTGAGDVQSSLTPKSAPSSLARSSKEDDIARLFEGSWSSDHGEYKSKEGKIDGVGHSNQESSLCLPSRDKGKVFDGFVSGDGAKIIWTDNDVWRRVKTNEPHAMQDPVKLHLWWHTFPTGSEPLM